MQSTIFHLDMDAFFVSVEELYDPSLKGKPVIVGGKANERGVVAAASYEARKFGVHSAMPLRTAGKLCPQAVFVDGHPQRYREKSMQVRRVLERFTPAFDMASIDEAYLDMTGTERLLGHPLRAAHKLHEAVARDTQLNCSIGIAGTRVVAKMMSDLAKRNGILYVVPGMEAQIIAPLQVRRMPGVGKVTEQKLQRLGIYTIGQLALRDDLREHLGAWGAALGGKGRGEDAGGWFDEAIGSDSAPKSISHEHTFSRDAANPDLLQSTLARLTEMTARRLRECELHARTVQLKLRYEDFTTITRAHSLPEPTQVDAVLLDAVRRLFHANWKNGRPVRLLGVHLSGFEAPVGQLELGAEKSQARWGQALQAADRMRDRFGDSAVSLGGALKSQFRERTHESPAVRRKKDQERPA
ncbi:MAG: DNA polymerase IV [Acidobacteria bacterium]|nr:DNA polymerase IV [Acidobacteriota bacterium]